MRNASAEQLGLYDDTVERTVLAAAIKNEAWADVAIAKLRPEVFSTLDRQLIFEATVALRERNQPVSEESVFSEARLCAGRRKLKSVTVVTKEKIRELLAHSIEGADVHAHIESLLRLYSLRMFTPQIEDVIQFMASRPTPGAMQERLIGLISSVSLVRQDDASVLFGWDVPGYLDDLIGRLENQTDKRRFTMPWRAMDFVAMLTGGLMMILAGPDGSGKSSCAEEIAKHWVADRNLRIAYVGTEYTRDYVMVRLLSQLSGLTTSYIMEGRFTPAQRLQLSEAREEVAARYANLHFVEARGKTPRQVCGELVALRNMGQLDGCVIDYIQDMDVSAMGRDRNDRVNETTKLIHHTLGDMDAAGVVVAQGRKDLIEVESLDELTREKIDLPAQALAKAQLTIVVRRIRLDADGSDKVVATNGLMTTGGKKGQWSSVIDFRVDKQTNGQVGNGHLYYYKNLVVADLPDAVRQAYYPNEELPEPEHFLA